MAGTGRQVELCAVETADGVVLDGILERPTGKGAAELPVDAFLIVHGTGSNFYSHGLLETFSAQAIRAGVAALRINTRGHDVLVTLRGRGGSRPGGAAYETLSDCRFDLTAWLNFLANSGFRKVVLIGHSVGGVKAVYAMAHMPHPVVSHIVAISPPRFRHEYWMQHPDAQDFRTSYAEAEQLDQAGRGEDFLEVRQPLPLVVTAAGYLGKYGPHDSYDYTRYLGQLGCPTLIVIGTGSVAASPAFAAQPEDVAELTRQHAHLMLELVDSADTGYTNCPDEPFRRVRSWLR